MANFFSPNREQVKPILQAAHDERGSIGKHLVKLEKFVDVAIVFSRSIKSG